MDPVGCGISRIIAHPRSQVQRSCVVSACYKRVYQECVLIENNKSSWLVLVSASASNRLKGASEETVNQEDSWLLTPRSVYRIYSAFLFCELQMGLCQKHSMVCSKSWHIQSPDIWNRNPSGTDRLESMVFCGVPQGSETQFSCESLLCILEAVLDTEADCSGSIKEMVTDAVEQRIALLYAEYLQDR